MWIPLSNEELYAVKRATEVFPIGDLQGVGRKLGGAFNSNIKIDTSRGQFVVRMMSQKQSKEHISYTQHVLGELRDQGLPVLIPLLAHHGEPFVAFQDKLLQVTPYVRATAFQNKPQQIGASARMLSRFHQASPSSSFQCPPLEWSFNRPTDYYTAAIATLVAMPEIPSYELNKVERMVETVTEGWVRAEGELATAIIHGDWHYWNQLYDENEVSCIMDFDFMEQGKRIHDVAYALWTIYILLPRHADVYEEIFMREYIGLTDAELAMLPIAIARVSLFLLCQSAYAPLPAEKWRRQYRKQYPLLKRLLSSEGQERFIRLYHN